MDDKENWIGIANRFANQGDFRGMRASAKEILQIVPEDADAYAIMAEASFYMDERESAKAYIARAEEREPGNLRARLVRAAFFSADFALEEEIKELLSIVQATEKVAESLWTQSLRYVRFKALAWLSDAWLLAVIDHGQAVKQLNGTLALLVKFLARNSVDLGACIGHELVIQLICGTLDGLVWTNAIQ